MHTNNEQKTRPLNRAVGVPNYNGMKVGKAIEHESYRDPCRLPSTGDGGNALVGVVWSLVAIAIVAAIVVVALWLGFKGGN